TADATSAATAPEPAARQLLCARDFSAHDNDFRHAKAISLSLSRFFGTKPTARDLEGRTKKIRELADSLSRKKGILSSSLERKLRKKLSAHTSSETRSSNSDRDPQLGRPFLARSSPPQTQPAARFFLSGPLGPLSSIWNSPPTLIFSSSSQLILGAHAHREQPSLRHGPAVTAQSSSGGPLAFGPAQPRPEAQRSIRPSPAHSAQLSDEIF
ncbi:hypothetical protein CRG98_048169, partial [Punica granatum]